MTNALIDACRRALPRLQPRQALTSNDQHERLYRDRGSTEMRRLAVRLEASLDNPDTKMIFSGHVGTGKSTELFHLKRQLEARNRATIIYFSAKDHVDLVGLNTVGLLEAIARAVSTFRIERGDEQVDPSALDEAIIRAREKIRRVRISEQSVTGSAGLEASAGILSAGAGLSTQRSSRQEYVYEDHAALTSMVEIVNQQLDGLRALRKDSPPVLLLCDDLEKLDLETAREVFKRSLALAGIRACAVFTVPIALLYSRERGLLDKLDDSETVLPIIKVRDRQGQPIAENIALLREMVLPRLPELDEVMSDAAFTELVLSSGGVLRDLVRMLREACLHVMTHAPPQRIDVGDLAPVFAVVRNSFLRQVHRDLYPRLREVQGAGSARGGGMDAALAQLLNLTAVLEHTNDETWYRVHPLAEFLLEDHTGS